MGEKQTLIGWAAGFIDGEGCILVMKNKPHNGVSPIYYLRLKATSTRLEPLLRLKSLFGGSISENKFKNPGSKWKRVFNWVIHGERATLCLEKILPYLTIKVKQAKLGLELQNLKRTKRHQKTVALTDGELKRRESIFQEMKVLNERGKPKRSVQLALAREEEKQASFSLPD